MSDFLGWLTDSVEWYFIAGGLLVVTVIAVLFIDKFVKPKKP
jgi:p-aminobenzoyl-glutamate transporter AbgT